MAKKTNTIKDLKNKAKDKAVTSIKEYFEAQGLTVYSSDEVDEKMTQHTIVVRGLGVSEKGQELDIQVKIIAPKTDLAQYELVDEDEE